MISFLFHSKVSSPHPSLWLLTLVTQPPSFSIILHWLKGLDACSSGYTHGSALLHWSSATASYLVCSKTAAPVPSPPERYLRILTAIFSDCGSGDLAREFGFIHHDAPPVENHTCHYHAHGFLLSKRNRLELQSRTNCPLGSHHWYKATECKGNTEGLNWGRRKDDTMNKYSTT